MSYLLRKLRLLLWLGVCLGPLYGQSVVLTSGGFPTVNGYSPATPVSTQSGPGAALESHLSFGNVAANSGGRRVRISIPVRISATTNYKLELQRTPFSGSSSIQPQDVGFGILNARPQTGNNPKLAAHATACPSTEILAQIPPSRLSSMACRTMPPLSQTSAKVRSRC